jgi:hypothetical protein
MERYRIITLVDITRTNPLRSDPDVKKQNQQSNFNSLSQAIGLRGMVVLDKPPKIEEGRLPDPWTGKARHWVYDFEVERFNVFDKDDEPLGLLLDDLDGVPIIDGLNNSTDFDIPVFKTRGKKINTLVQKLE